jgi:hypothetical protein
VHEQLGIPYDMANNIALVVLNNPVPFGPTIQGLKLLDAGDLLADSETVRDTGWGRGDVTFARWIEGPLFGRSDSDVCRVKGTDVPVGPELIFTGMTMLGVIVADRGGQPRFAGLSSYDISGWPLEFSTRIDYYRDWIIINASGW